MGDQLKMSAGGGAPKNAAVLRLAKPQRKDSLGMISVSSVQGRNLPKK